MGLGLVDNFGLWPLGWRVSLQAYRVGQQLQVGGRARDRSCELRLEEKGLKKRENLGPGENQTMWILG